MILHRSHCAALLIFFCLAAGCRSSRTDQETATAQTGIWQRTPLLIDGSDNDWIRPLPYHDKKDQLSYSITNDKENLYIMLATGDKQEQQKIIQGGLTVWFNTHGEKEEGNSAGIAFPTDSRNNRDRNLMAAARPDLAQKNVESLTDLKDYSLFGFNKEQPIQTYEYGARNEQDIEVTVAFNNAGELIYEARVPFKSLFPMISSPAAGRRSIAVGFFMEGIPPQPGQDQGGGGSGVSVGGGLGFGSYGGSGVGISIGTGLGRIGGRKSQLNKQAKIWQVVNLASH